MSNNIVFVIGSGASKEADLPTGDELKKHIENLLDYEFDTFGDLNKGDKDIFKILQQTAKSYNELVEYIHICSHIKEHLMLAISIDNFIDNQRDDGKIAFIGKLAIVKSIFNAERNSRFKIEEKNLVLSSASNTWYIPFFQRITENCNKEDLIEKFSKITLVIFNYDRCIEYFLFHTIRSFYKATDSETIDIINAISIYHPYGSVGALPYFDNNGINFGANLKHDEILELSEKIKTFTEGTSPKSSDIISIRKNMSKASNVVFLGFGFIKRNLEIIKPSPEPVNTPIFYASTYGFSTNAEEEIKTDLKKLFYIKGVRIQADTYLANKKCCEFFKEYERGLSF